MDKLKLSGKRKSLESNEHSEGAWAVSYADFLMVLLSFFIVFFNVDEKTGNTSHYLAMVEDLAKNPSFQWAGDSKEETVNRLRKRSTQTLIQNENKTVNSLNTLDGGPHFPYKVNELAIFPPALTPQSWRSLAQLFNDQEMIITFDFREDDNDSKISRSPSSGVGEEEGILIQLPDDIYNKGSFEVNGSIKDYLDKLSSKIKEIKGVPDYQILIIGHSDQSPIKNLKGTVASNIGLSSLRAIHAAEYLIHQGFRKNQVMIQGSSDMDRNTRSLSLKIIFL